MKPPFPYHGRKVRHAARIWQELGDPDVYAEPFAGTLSVLINRPTHGRLEIVCDKDANIVNFWRAVRGDPHCVVRWADAPTFHQECTARHRWIQRTNAERAAAVRDDMDYYDAKAAGIWVHGISNSIGHGYGTENVLRVDGLPLDQRPNVNLYQVGICTRSADLREWILQLSKRLANVVVLDRDWTSAVVPRALMQTDHSEVHKPTVAVFLDPPYRNDNGRKNGLYVGDEQAPEVAAAAYEWALEHGGKYRIAYAMNVDDFPVPDGWSYVDWPTFGKKPDRILFSPACAGGRQLGLFQ